MKVIKKLSELIEDELKMSECYVDKALEYKEEYASLAKVLYGISLQEMEHVTALHKSVVELIEDYRRDHGDPPADMRAVYDYLHKRHIDHAAEIKTKQNMYKEG